MNKRIVMILLAIISVAALAGACFTILSPFTKDDTRTLPPLEHAKSIYAAAASLIDPTHDSIQKISQTQEMIVDGTTFLEVSEKTIRHDMQPSGNPQIQLSDTITSGPHTITVTEVFSDNTVYTTVNNTPFTSTCSVSQYKSALIPHVIITPQLYNNISGVDNGHGYTIHFSEPTKLEEWVTDGTATLVEARGNATISYEGVLKNSMYTASYRQGDITFRTTVHIDVEQTNVDIEVPDDVSNYTEITDWQAPKILERACGYLLQANKISSTYNDSIYFQAIGDHREQHITLHAHNDGQWSMGMETAITLKNDSKQTQETSTLKKELFLNGEYTASSDSTGSIANIGITVDTVYNYFQNQLVSTIILPKDILTADIADNEDAIRINFTGTNDFGKYLTESVCKILYQDPSLLADTGSKVTTKQLQCYLEIDKFTGLPMASGIDFTGSYKTEGLPYQIQYSAEQSYIIPSNAAMTEIEKAAGK